MVAFIGFTQFCFFPPNPKWMKIKYVTILRTGDTFNYLETITILSFKPKTLYANAKNWTRATKFYSKPF